jgi:hypothetical protein
MLAQHVLIERTAPLHLRQQTHQLRLLKQRGALCPRLAHTFQRLAEARLADGLQQIVQGLGLEGLDRITIVGGDQDHHRERLLRHLRQQLQA